MAVTGSLVGLDAATLASLKTEYTSCLLAIANVGQSYSIGGRSFTKADGPFVRDMLAEITYAQQRAAGTLVTMTVPRFGSPY